MVRQAPDRMSLLSLLEVSQSAVESSDQALRAAEEALAAAQTANTQAKEVLKAVSEAFVQEDKKLTNLTEKKTHSEENVANRTRSIDCESDEDSDGLKDFVILSTNKNPVHDIEDDTNEDISDPEFFLFSSTGPAAFHHHSLGLYRQFRQAQIEHSTEHRFYIQEKDEDYELNSKGLLNMQGIWFVVTASEDGQCVVLMKTANPSQSPTSVTWQYFDFVEKQFFDDHTITVTSHSERPIKDGLKAIPEAFVQEDKKLTFISEKKETKSVENCIHKTLTKPIMDIESDDDSDDKKTICMLSSINKNPEDSTCPKFYLVSTGADVHKCNISGLYSQTEEIRDGRNVYIQEDIRLGFRGYPYKLISEKGVWMVMSTFPWPKENVNVYLRAVSPSQSPASVKWQYYDDPLNLNKNPNRNLWIDDQSVSVTALSERPTSACEITITLSESTALDMEDPGVAGVYRPEGTYHEGRPVLRHTGGQFILYVSGSGWFVGAGVGGLKYLYKGNGQSICPAHDGTGVGVNQLMKNWNLWTKRSAWIETIFGVRVTCSKHTCWGKSP